MMYTFFVLDYDGTYDNEADYTYGVSPSVFLIKESEQKQVEELAVEANRQFHSTLQETNECLGNIFENLMKKNNIFFQYIGDLQILFGERQINYLPDYIPRVVV